MVCFNVAAIRKTKKVFFGLGNLCTANKQISSEFNKLESDEKPMLFKLLQIDLVLSVDVVSVQSYKKVLKNRF